jgi:hypothetical protein
MAEIINLNRDLPQAYIDILETIKNGSYFISETHDGMTADECTTADTITREYEAIGHEIIPMLQEMGVSKEDIKVLTDAVVKNHDIAIKELMEKSDPETADILIQKLIQSPENKGFDDPATKKSYLEVLEEARKEARKNGKVNTDGTLIVTLTQDEQRLIRDEFIKKANDMAPESENIRK